jgi:uncharacterized protein with HEPN domain
MIAAFRNVLAHQYLGVDIDLVWQMAARDLPGLKTDIRRVADDRGVALDP